MGPNQICHHQKYHQLAYHLLRAKRNLILLLEDHMVVELIEQIYHQQKEKEIVSNKVQSYGDPK